MKYYISPSKIAELAMTVEAVGERFYAELANAADNEKIKSIFSALSKAELKHLAIFKNIADKFSVTEESEYTIDLLTVMRTHIDELKNTAFSTEKLSDKPSDMEEALKIAIHSEVEAIRIYTEMYNLLVGKFHDVLMDIINEEKTHLDILQGIKLEDIQARE